MTSTLLRPCGIVFLYIQDAQLLSIFIYILSSFGSTVFGVRLWMMIVEAISENDVSLLDENVRCDIHPSFLMLRISPASARMGRCTDLWGGVSFHRCCWCCCYWRRCKRWRRWRW